MALTFRLIARLDVRNEYLIKPIRCEGVRRVGKPEDYVERYDAAGIDEFYLSDTVASLYGRNALGDLVAHAADKAFCPVTVAGGVRSIADARALFLAGADKIALNTAACARPEIIGELARKFGAQAVVLQLDAKRKNGSTKVSRSGTCQSISWDAYCDGARQPTSLDAL